MIRCLGQILYKTTSACWNVGSMGMFLDGFMFSLDVGVPSSFSRAADTPLVGIALNTSEEKCVYNLMKWSICCSCYIHLMVLTEVMIKRGRNDAHGSEMSINLILVRWQTLRIIKGILLKSLPFWWSIFKWSTVICNISAFSSLADPWNWKWKLQSWNNRNRNYVVLGI